MEQFKEHDFVRLEKTGEIAIIKGKRIFDEYSAYRVLNGKLKEGMGIRGVMRLATQSEIDNFLNSLVNYNLYWTGQRIRRYPRIGRKYFYITAFVQCLCSCCKIHFEISVFCFMKRRRRT